MKPVIPTFETEAALCQAFILTIPPEWVVYPETAGWDILLVHRVGGWQIGVEAKLSLNAKVLEQAIRNRGQGYPGPDFRAVLVGRIVAENAVIARALGLTVIAPLAEPWINDWSSRYTKHGPRIPRFSPDLPEAEALTKIGDWWYSRREEWFDQFPTQREPLPAYVPEVAAGVPSPMVLSDWKIKAMRVCIWVERNGFITRAHFRALCIDPSRWMNGYWLQAGPERGLWVAGPQFPGRSLRREHPNIFAKVEADYDTWSAKVTGKGGA
jgi:hypothetical protein